MKRLLLALLLPIVAAAQGITFGTPVFSHALNSTPTFATTSVSMSYDMLNQGALFVGCSVHTYPQTKVGTVFVGGVAATLIAEAQGVGADKPDTVFYVAQNVQPGIVSIAASSTGGATHGYGLECGAQAAYGTNQLTPVVSHYVLTTPVLGSGTQTASCTFTPWAANEAFITFEYSTAYNTSMATTGSIGEEVTTGRFTGLQMAFAAAANLTYTPDNPYVYTEKWTFTHSTTSVQADIITALIQ